MRTLVLIVALAMSTPAMAFEGEIQLKGTDAAASGLAAMTVLISKNGDVSMELTTRDPDGATREVGYLKPSKGRYNYMLDYKRKRALQVPKDTFDNVDKSSPPDDALQKANVQVEKLGHEKIAGHATRHIRITDKDTGGVSDLWLSDKYPAQLWSQAMGFGDDGPNDPVQAWNEAAEKLGFKPGFPMKVLNQDRRGAQDGLEVVKIAEKKVDDKRFFVPADYEIQEMHMPARGPGDMPNKAPANAGEAE
ncbi:MAG: DUF4412 domain-containing protein [Polyangiales bacterium]